MGGKDSSIPFKAHYLSDDTLRFICLVTVLLQSDELAPSTYNNDEPELGLHLSAINLLAGIIRSVSAKRQIIISTQSTNLLNGFSADDVIVTELKHGMTTLKRLDAKKLESWFEEYNRGELWEKNVLGARQ